MRKVREIHRAGPQHWVGDGFPVRTIFSYDRAGDALSPFLLLDHAGPARFTPTGQKRGVGVHPHRGFETVTIVYEGEVEHHDSAGNGGLIGAGDVQWMTAASGILHEEYHSPGFARTGGTFEVAQLWVNLPARAKMTSPGYQTLLKNDIPVVEPGGRTGLLRVIAGEFEGRKGPARTFTPMNVWDVRLRAAGSINLTLPGSHNASLVVLKGKVLINAAETVNRDEVVLFERAHGDISLHAELDSIVLVLTGEPLNEPIAGYGPFVMNTHEEIQQAFVDYHAGRFARAAAARV
ncbi:MAG TPA: pirin family protein [Burkholderiales bacterium]|nr:pirin family protein [Burkholderiales bacterium]